MVSCGAAPLTRSRAHAPSVLGGDGMVFSLGGGAATGPVLPGDAQKRPGKGPKEAWRGQEESQKRARDHTTWKRPEPQAPKTTPQRGRREPYHPQGGEGGERGRALWDVGSGARIIHNINLFQKKSVYVHVNTLDFTSSSLFLLHLVVYFSILFDQFFCLSLCDCFVPYKMTLDGRGLGEEEGGVRDRLSESGSSNTIREIPKLTSCNAKTFPNTTLWSR